MPALVRPPKKIVSNRFVVSYSRPSDTYVLHLPEGNSYVLGAASKALAYLVPMLGERIGEDAISLAYNFGGAQVVQSEGRVVQTDLRRELLDDMVNRSMAGTLAAQEQNRVSLFST